MSGCTVFGDARGFSKGEGIPSFSSFDLEGRDVGLENLSFLEPSDSVLAAHDAVNAFGKAADVTSDNRSVLCL